MKAAIFDMDGTLVDSMERWANCCVAPLDAMNIPYPDDLLNIITPMGYADMADYYRNEFGLDMHTDEMVKTIADKMAVEYETVEVKDGVYDYLERLKSRGVKMCILTATARKYGLPCLERLGLMKYFEFYACCDELGMSKSNPEIFKKVASTLDFDISECTVFEDNVTAALTAKKAGAAVCAVYDNCSKNHSEEIKKNCDRYIISYNELL